jgi:hypothetical protein
MRNDLDYIINLMSKFTTSTNDGEIGEQDSAGGTPSGGGGGAKPKYPSVTKWETGLTRGPANQIGNTKWSDIVKVNRGKANTLL